MELIYLWRADADIQEAFNWYEEFREGWGFGFLSEIEHETELLLGNPEMGRIYLETIRRKLLFKHPYAIFYVIEGNRIVVMRVLNTRQSPERIQEMLRGRG